MISKSLYTFVFAVLFTGAAFAGAPAIGIVTANGHVTVEHSQVWGNSTLFNGATVETTTASSQLALRSGVRLQLGADSRARIFDDRAVIEKGIGQIAGSATYELDAATLKIHAGDTGRLRVTVGDHVEVAALSGSARVSTGAGLLLASIPVGRRMNFALQAGATGTIARAGCLLYKDNHFIIQDDDTQEVAELSGQALAANVGNRVEAIGTVGATRPVVSIATSVLNVTKVNVKSQGGCLSAAAALNAQTEAPASASSAASTAAKAGAAGAAGGAAAGTAAGTAGGAAAGLSTGAIVAIVAGGGGAAAGAAIALSSHKSSSSP